VSLKNLNTLQTVLLFWLLLLDFPYLPSFSGVVTEEEISDSSSMSPHMQEMTDITDLRKTVN
jgi:hypothetical protein